jgi:hypothetical protein
MPQIVWDDGMAKKKNEKEIENMNTSEFNGKP